MNRIVIPFLLLSFLSGSLELDASDDARHETVYFAMEMNGEIVGYSETEIIPGKSGGEPTLEKMTLILRLKVLGQDFDVQVEATSKSDPATGKPFLVDAEVTRGKQKNLGSTYIFNGNEVRIEPKAGGAARTVTLEDDVLLDDSLRFDCLVRDFSAGDLESKTYKIFTFIMGQVHERTYTLKGKKNLHLLGQGRVCMVFDMVDHNLGVTSRLWIEMATGRAVRTEASTGISSYLSDKTVKAMVVRGDLDDRILADVQVSIPDFQSLSYMKVRAKVRAAGEWITAERLNVPGQKFEGVVKDNFIDGVFEISHPRYDGSGAPPFPPPDYRSDEGLNKYVEPEDLIESDDPVLIAKAEELTRGAKDSWDAAVRLSRWVAEEIGYSIPGGSARYTYDTGKGECGSHSRLLTALCRGLGIPARVVGGCMYVPMRGGCFGQHGWNEIYMGDGGWITVDSTVKEIDYVDSGHIRLGVNTGFNPEEMEILDYRVGTGEPGAAEPAGNRAGLEPLSEASCEVPYRVGETYTFEYKVEGRPVGNEAFTVMDRDPSGRCAFRCRSTVAFGEDLSSTVTYELDSDGFPLGFRNEGKARGQEFLIECAFSDGRVQEKIVQGGQPVERTIKLPERVRLVASNNVSLVAFLVLLVPDREGETREFKVFHPSSMQVLPAQVTAAGRESISWRGREVHCRLLEFSLAGTKIQTWTDEQGRLIRKTEGQGGVVTELAGVQR